MAEGIWVDDVATAKIAGIILAHAHNAGADLIVSGAFGHPRLWEKVLGGVTRELLATMTVLSPTEHPPNP